jgi:Mg2+-importing ATPase
MAFWNEPTDQLLKRLQSTATGITSESAQEKLRTFGPTSLSVAQRHLVWQFLKKFSNPLILTLLFASGVSALTGESLGFILIILMVFLSVTLDFYQNYRAEKAAEDLKKKVLISASVRRDGKIMEIPFSEIVPGATIPANQL